MITARVLQRTLLGGLLPRGFAEAQERSLEAARAYEQLGTYRNAAIAYSVLYVIAHNWSGDFDVARFYAERVTMNGRRAHDLSWQNLAWSRRWRSPRSRATTGGWARSGPA